MTRTEKRIWAAIGFALTVWTVIVLLASSAVNAHDAYPVELLRVIDGDTVRVRVNVWPGDYKDVNVRIRGVDTAELRRPHGSCERNEAEAAKAFVIAWTQGVVLELHDVGPNKYWGRVVGDLYADGESLADALLAKGHAVRYDGGKKGAWRC